MATTLTYDADTSAQKYSGRRATHGLRVPFQRRHAFAGRHVPTPWLLVDGRSPDTTRRPSGNTATLQTYDEDRSSQRYSGRRNAHNPSALSASALRRASMDRVRKRHEPQVATRRRVATALASQIDCKTFIGSASDGVVATSASAAAFSATGASTASFGGRLLCAVTTARWCRRRFQPQ